MLSIFVIRIYQIPHLSAFNSYYYNNFNYDYTWLATCICTVWPSCAPSICLGHAHEVLNAHSVPLWCRLLMWMQFMSTMHPSSCTTMLHQQLQPTTWMYICAVYGVITYSFCSIPLNSMIDEHNSYHAQFSKWLKGSERYSIFKLDVNLFALFHCCLQ